MRTALYLIVTIVGALAATITATVGMQPAIVGAAAFLAFAGLAGAAASAAVDLNLSDDLKEPREARGPTNPPPFPEEKLARRTFGKLWFAAIGAFVVGGFVPLVAIARKPGRRPRTGWKPGTRLVRSDNTPVKLDELVVGGVETVFPEGGIEEPESSAMLIRVAPELLQMPPDRQGWTPDGYIAYSKICTHAGCPVALYRQQSHQLYCPCHQSMFDVLRLAANISGPAPRPLPQLGLDVDDKGFLIARDDFAGPVGPDDWDRIR
jgi:ubiquinol-cytochrome c reductase iron-sulfur subunit